MFRRDQETAPDLVFDPMADLFFSVVAIVVLAVIIILPTIRLQASITPEAKSPAFEIGGHAVDPIRATATGLTFGADGASHVALNAIDDDDVFAATIRRASQGDVPLLLLIEPDGDEAAFQLEPVLARAGITSVRQVRLDPGCSHMQGVVRGGVCPVASHAGAAP